MKIGVAAATHLEIQPTIDFLDNSASTLPFHNFDIIITGVGLLAAAYSMADYVIRQQPGLLIQAGIGGTFTDKIPPGQVVIIKEEIIGDQGA
ncbi:MAG: futalosine hydrolase, partial [Chitinophagaceae bacterium]